jgi:hypothetical protein
VAHTVLPVLLPSSSRDTLYHQEIKVTWITGSGGDSSEDLEIWAKALEAPDYKTLQVARMEMVGNG